MLDVEKAQEYFGFAGGWRPQRVEEELSQEQGGDALQELPQQAGLQAAVSAQGAALSPHAGDGDAQLAREAEHAHCEELFDGMQGWQDDVAPWEWEPPAAQPHAEERARGQAAPEAATRAPLIAVVSGSGGVGRSTVALLCAALAASQGIDTALIEGDLQFGDLSFWLGLDDSLPNLGDPRSCAPVSCPPGFALYRAPLFPEVAEEVEDALAAEVERMRAGRELVIADTGGMWSGFTASLLLQCDLFFMVVDQRPSSVASALKASELCHRLKVPRTRMVVVYNRWSSKAALSAREVGTLLDATHVCCVQDAREPLDELLRSGGVPELLASDNAAVNGARELLRQALPRVGCSFEGTDARRRGLFR